MNTTTNKLSTTTALAELAHYRLDNANGRIDIANEQIELLWGLVKRMVIINAVVAVLMVAAMIGAVLEWVP